jgi:hypothetical protein
MNHRRVRDGLVSAGIRKCPELRPSHMRRGDTGRERGDGHRNPRRRAAGATWALAWQGTDNADGLVGTNDGGLLFAQEQLNRVSKLDRNDRCPSLMVSHA